MIEVRLFLKVGLGVRGYVEITKTQMAQVPTRGDSFEIDGDHYEVEHRIWSVRSGRLGEVTCASVCLTKRGNFTVVIGGKEY